MERILTIDAMDAHQSKAWNDLFDSWLRDIFKPALKSLHYKQDCIQCGDIYFLTRFYVDEQGLVHTYEITREEIDCREKTVQQNKELREAVTSDFGAWIFPHCLQDTIIEARMGAVTRC